MSDPTELIRDAAASGDFLRAAALWQQHSAEFDLRQLSELIALVRQSAADARSHSWVANTYRTAKALPAKITPA